MNSGTHSIRFRVFRAILGLSMLGSLAAAQPAPGLSPDGVWRRLTPQEEADFRIRQPTLPDQRWIPVTARLYELIEKPLAAKLGTVPSEPSDRKAVLPPDAQPLYIPTPDGTYVRFAVVRSPVMAPDLARRHPEIRTLRGQGDAKPHRSSTVRITTNTKGRRFSAQVLSTRGTWYVFSTGDGLIHASVYRKSAVPPFIWRGSSCGYAPDPASSAPDRWGATYRKYRLALACTADYTKLNGGFEETVNAIVEIANFVTGIYEKDVAIRFELVAGNDNLISPPDACIFGLGDNPNVGPLMAKAPEVFEAKIGASAYDLGHTLCVVVSPDGEGLAHWKGARNPLNKAKGVSGHPDVASPLRAVFWTDYVAHEMGHQLGATHTFDSKVREAERWSATAYEPGSGSTIMGYAGLCKEKKPPGEDAKDDNLQLHSDQYFHAASQDQLVYSSEDWNIAEAKVTGNTPPTVKVPSKTTIPKLTPFELTASGDDEDEQDDTLTYCWEQLNKNATAVYLSDPDNGKNPLFRSFPPSEEPRRVFPAWPGYLGTSIVPGERLPSLKREMRFRVTVRDNRSGVARKDVIIQVDDESGPFQVQNPVGALSGASVIQWEVARTARQPVNAEFVNIRLSTDGGRTFPIFLAHLTPNDGTQFVALPAVASDSARIKVESTKPDLLADTPKVRFFDVSDQDLVLNAYHTTILAVPPPPPNLMTPAVRETLQEFLGPVAFHRAYVKSRPGIPAFPDGANSPWGFPVYSFRNPRHLAGQLAGMVGGQRVLVHADWSSLKALFVALGVPQAGNLTVENKFELWVVVLTGGTPHISRIVYASDS